MRVAAVARRRLMLRRIVALLGPGLVAGGAAALVVVGATRLWPDLGPWAMWAAACIAVGALAALGAALARRPSLLAAAAVVDGAMGFRDRLTNGVALLRGDARRRDAFAALALEDAEQAAGEANVQRATPIRFGGAWGWAAVVIAAAAAVGLFVPERTPASPVAAAQERRAEAREQAAAALQQAIDEAHAETPPERLDLATRERIEALEELERQLLDGRLEPGEAMDEALRTLNEAAQREQEEAQRALAAQEAMRERLARSGAPEKEVSPLARALREGDLASAQRAAESLLDRREELTAEEAGRVAEDLRQLAEALRAEQEETARAVEEGEQLAHGEQEPGELGRETPPAAGEAQPAREEDPIEGGEPREQAETPEGGREQPPQSALEEALREQGVPPEQARELAEQPDPKRVREALEQQGVDPQVADDVAEQAEQERRRQEAEERAEEEARRLSEALERAAESLERQHLPEPGQAQERQQGQKPPQEQAQREPAQSGEEQSTGQQSQQQPGQKQPSSEPQQPSQELGEQQQAEGQQEGQSQQEPASSPVGQQQGAQPQPGQTGQEQPASPEERQRTEQPGAQPEQQPSPGPGETPGEQAQRVPQPGEQPGQERGSQPGDQQTDGLKQLLQELQRQQQQGQSSEQSQRNAERLREQARQMLESASPEERERLRRWAQDMAQEQDSSPPGGRAAGDGPRPPLAPGDHPAAEFEEEVIDARGEAPAGDEPRREQVIAEWYSDKPAEPGQAGSGTAAEAISRARRAAERDMGNRTIHPRYHELLREYFKRLPAAPDEGSGAIGGGTRD